VIGRVTQQTVQRSTLANLQLNLTRMSNLQQKMSSGKTISRPSDDPAGTVQALALRSEVKANGQYSRNAEDGAAWLTTADTALQSTVTQLRRIRDLTVQSGSGNLAAVDREAMATELDGLRDSLLSLANTTYVGRPVFAGTSDAGTAFTDGVSPTPYSWTGTDGASVQRRLAKDATVQADVDGRDAFGEGATSVFALVDTISTELRAGTDVTGHLAGIDDAISAVLGELSGVGTRYNQVTAAQSDLAAGRQDLQFRLSGVEDIDLAQVIVDLQSQEVAYQGALGATSRVLQPTLMDFLR
jgi:flagellar hook-associated protein 3 FlgL